jgi:hypothetical protein
MNRTIRTTVTVAVALVAALAFTATAGAQVTQSDVAAPNSPHFSILTPANKTIAVSGTTDGTTGDKVDLQCYFGSGPSHATLATGVGVLADGSFTVPAAELEKLSDGLCVLRAVPAGELPTDLTPYTGPLMASGEAEDKTIGSGTNAGHLYDFYAWAQQLGGAFDYVSAGKCGIYDGYLFDSSPEETATTFYCNDGFYAQPVGYDRSAIQVDGANAYASYTAEQINGGATNLPGFSYSITQNPLNGDTTINESDGISVCPGATFPPTAASCPSFIDTGVRLDRTIVQSNDGRLATITDRFISADGQPHSIDTLTENDQNFENHADKLGYRFPGQAAYFEPATKQVVAFPDSKPGTVYVQVEGAPDGDTKTGRGAIVFGEPASPATFATIESTYSEFYFHQTASIPAGGSATKRFAYVQAYAQAEVEALAQQVEAAFQPMPTPAPPTTSTTGSAKAQTPAPFPPSNKLELLGAKLNKRKGTALLTVKVPDAGRLTLSGKKVKTAKRMVKRAGLVKLNVAAKPKFATTLAARGKLKVGLKLVFAPTGGSPRAVHRNLTLIRE